MKLRSVLLAAVMVFSVVAIASPATAAVTSSERTVSDNTIAPGESVTVTMTSQLDSEATGYSLEESFSGQIQGATFPSAAVGGSSANLGTGGASASGLVATLANRNLADTTVTVTYTVTASSSAGQITISDGDSSDISAGTTTINVEEQDGVTASLPDGETLTPSIEDGGLITQDVVVTNNGDQAATETVSLSIQDADGNAVDEASATVENLPAGESQTETLSVQANADPGEYTLVLAAGGTQQLSQELTVTDPANTAAITGDVRNLEGGSVTAVEELDIRVFQDGNEIEDSPVNPDVDGEYTIDVPVADGGSSYSVEVDNPRFISFSRQVEVFPQSTERIDIRLNSDLEADKVGVALWDSEQEQVIGDAAALLADGEFDGPVELVVYAQAQDLNNQPAPAAPSTTTADVTVENLDGAANIFDAGQGAFLDPNDDEASTDDVSVALNDGVVSADDVDTDVDDTATVDADTEFDVDGEVRYGTFSVTAGDVTKEEVEEFADAVAQGEIEATINEAGISDTSDLTYFVEGEKSTQHQVLDTDGEPINGANVFVSYAGAPQNFDDVQEFQNDAGESFLTATTDEDGTAVIPGLVPEVDYHVYVQADGFNIFNSSTAAAQGASDLTAATGIEQGTFVADYTLFEAIDAGAEGAGDEKVYAHTLRQTPQDIALDVTVADADGSQVKSTDVPSGDLREIEVSATAGEIGQDVSEFDDLGGQTINVELTDDTAGSLVGANDAGVAQVTTDENGTATVTFSAVEDQDRDTNVTASTTNANNDLYATEDDEGQGVNDDNNQAEIDVFTTGTLTGDVLDQNEDPIPFATVSLSVFNATSGEFEQIRDEKTISESGQYVFEDLPTNEEYRVNGEFNGDTGFATITDLNPGTNTRDVVISEALAPTGFSVSDLDAPSEASPGDVITVSANITNIGGSTATDTAEFRLAGDTVQDESLTLGANEQQEVSFDVTVPDVEEGTYTHGIFTSDFEQTADLTVTVEEDAGDGDFADEDFNQEQFDAVFGTDGDQTQDELSSAINTWFNSDDNTVDDVTISQDALSGLTNYWFNEL